MAGLGEYRRPPQSAAADLPGLTTREAAATGRFWILLLMFFLVAVALNGTVAHVVPLLTDAGLSPAKAAATTLGKHGAKVVYVNEDKAFDDFIAEPATDALAVLFKAQSPDLILFGFTSDSRDVAGRLECRYS